MDREGMGQVEASWLHWDKALLEQTYLFIFLLKHELNKRCRWCTKRAVFLYCFIRQTKCIDNIKQHLF